MSIDSRVSDESERNSSHNFRNFLFNWGIAIFFFFLFAVSRHLVLRTESTEESTIGGGWEMPPPEPAVDRAQSSLEG